MLSHIHLCRSARGCFSWRESNATPTICWRYPAHKSVRRRRSGTCKDAGERESEKRQDFGRCITHPRSSDREPQQDSCFWATRVPVVPARLRHRRLPRRRLERERGHATPGRCGRWATTPLLRARVRGSARDRRRGTAFRKFPSPRRRRGSALSLSRWSIEYVFYPVKRSFGLAFAIHSGAIIEGEGTQQIHQQAGLVRASLRTSHALRVKPHAVRLRRL
jgi:hypothetical protein